MSGLGHRATTVFGRFLAGDTRDLHPADHAEAAAFWAWLGDFDQPDLAGRRPARWPYWAVAAVLLVMITGSLSWFSRPSADRNVAQHFVTGPGERRVLHLADGSAVTIAPGSRVDIAYVPGERRIVLSAGEALFDVAHDTARPFIVATPHGEVKAVGTSFDVAIAAHEAEVAVVEGVVRIALRADATGPASGEPIEKLARKGERVAFGVSRRGDESTGFIRQGQNDDSAGATAWTRGKLIFRGEPLRDVIAKINLYAPGRIALTDPAAGSIPVYGVIDQGDSGAIRDLIADPHAVAIEGDHR